MRTEAANYERGKEPSLRPDHLEKVQKRCERKENDEDDRRHHRWVIVVILEVGKGIFFGHCEFRCRNWLANSCAFDCLWRMKAENRLKWAFEIGASEECLLTATELVFTSINDGETTTMQSPLSRPPLLLSSFFVLPRLMEAHENPVADHALSGSTTRYRAGKA